MNRIILTKTVKNNKTYTVYALMDENGNYKDFQLLPEKDTIINNIYAARVNKILPGINAAFVTIAQNKSCYLSLNDAKNPVYTNKKSKKEGLCEGDEILVQVIKDALKTKDPVVTTKLSIFGSNVILTNFDTQIGVSSKLDKERAALLRKAVLLSCADHEKEGYGIIVRTNAKNVEDKVVSQDAYSVAQKYNQIIKKAPHQSLYSCVYHGMSDYLLLMKTIDFATVEWIKTDCDDIYDSLLTEYGIYDHAPEKIMRYDDSAISLSTLYGIRGLIDNLTSRRVWLDCGGNIIIEQLETLTFIDVNSAKNISSGSNSILKTNMEAAKEIARQLRLRNISGMIIIDFINMKSEASKDTLIEALKRYIKDDNTVCTFVDITKLGLVELTRKKVHKSLKQILEKTLDE